MAARKAFAGAARGSPGAQADHPPGMTGPGEEMPRR